MTFKFPLATILKYRADLEHREERLLMQRNQDVNLLQAKLDTGVSLRHEHEEVRIAQLTCGALGHDLHVTEDRILLLDAYLSRTRSELAGAIKEYKAQIKRFHAARQKRETLSGIQNEMQERFDHEQSRKDQQRTDELFASRYTRSI